MVITPGLAFLGGSILAGIGNRGGGGGQQTTTMQPPAYLQPFLGDISSLAQQQFFGSLGLPTPQPTNLSGQLAPQQPQMIRNRRGNFVPNPAYQAPQQSSPVQSTNMPLTIDGTTIQTNHQWPQQSMFPQQQYYPGSTVVPFSTETQAGLRMLTQRALQGSPLVDQAQGFLGGLFGGVQNPASQGFQRIAHGQYNPAMSTFRQFAGGMQNPALSDLQSFEGANPALSGLQSFEGTNPALSGLQSFNSQNPFLSNLQRTASGEYLQGPAFQQQFQAAADQILPQVQSQFALGGRGGSGLAAEAASQGLGRAFTNLLGQERGRQEAASQALAGFGGQDLNRQLSALGQYGQFGGQDLNRQLSTLGQIGQFGGQDLNRQLSTLGQIGQFGGQDLNRQLTAASGLSGAFNQGIGNQLSALQGLQGGFLGGLGAQLGGLGAVPGLAGQDFMDASQLLNVGGIREDLSGRYLQDQINRFNFDQQMPGQALNQYANLIFPQGGFGGQQITQLPQPSALQSMLGGGLTGMGLLNAFNSGAFAPNPTTLFT